VFAKSRGSASSLNDPFFASESYEKEGGRNLLMLWPITRLVILLGRRLPRLKLLVTTGMKNAAIHLDGAAARSITMWGARSLSDQATELT
jgi:hypothetical protein